MVIPSFRQAIRPSSYGRTTASACVRTFREIELIAQAKWGAQRLVGCDT